MDKAELEKFEQLKYLSETGGGKYLIENCKNVCINIIGRMCNNYTELNELELKVLCSKLDVNLKMFQLLTQVDDQIKAIEEILGPKKQEESLEGKP